MNRPASPIAVTLAQTAMELRLGLRRGENMLVTILIPAAVLVFFASVDVLPSGSGRPVDFLLPGSIALAVIATGLVSLGIATAYERQYGVLKRLGGSPLTRSNLIIAKVGGVLVVEAFQVALLVAIGLGLGWSPAPGTSVALLVLVLVLGTAVFTGLGLLLAGGLRAEVTMALANGLFLGTMLLGGIIVPLDRLPVAVADIAAWFPGAALADGLRIAFGSAGDPWYPLAILSVWSVAAVALAARTFRWE
jgi:ABC-2 type transport system permease protein